jgi:hypothetical protein
MNDWFYRVCKYLARFCRHPAGAAIAGTVVGGIILPWLKLVSRGFVHFLVSMLVGVDDSLMVAGAALRPHLLAFGEWWNDPVAVARHRMFVYPILCVLIGYWIARICELARQSKSSSDLRAS